MVIQHIQLSVIVFCVLILTARGFLRPLKHHHMNFRSLTHLKNDQQPAHSTRIAPLNAISRKEAFGRLYEGWLTPLSVATIVSTTTITAAATLTKPFPANASDIITSKIASQSALRYMKRSKAEFEKLEFYAVQNDYAGIKAGLRSPSLTEIRKNALILIKAGEDGPEAQSLSQAYADFIKSIEALDSSCSLGMRGKRGVQIYSFYQQSLEDLTKFLLVSEKSLALQMQIAE